MSTFGAKWWPAAMAVVAALWAAVSRGSRGLVSSVVASALVAGLFWLTFWVQRRSARLAPELVMVVGVGTYALKIVVLGMAFLMVWNASWINDDVFAFTVIAAVFAWMARIVVTALRSRAQIYDG